MFLVTCFHFPSVKDNVHPCPCLKMHEHTALATISHMLSEGDADRKEFVVASAAT